MSGYSRGNPSMGDVLRSVLVLGAIVLALWFVGRLITVTPDQPTSDADWRTAASGVADRAGFAPLVPSELPEGWRATRAELVDDRWQLNVVTKDGKFVGLAQRKGDAKGLQALVDDRLEGAEKIATVTADGQKWDQLDAGDDNGLARVVGSTAVVVYGTASAADLLDYARSLEPYASS